jgi:hypothetical protein
MVPGGASGSFVVAETRPGIIETARGPIRLPDHLVKR